MPRFHVNIAPRTSGDAMEGLTRVRSTLSVAGSLSFANLLSVCRWDVDPGWMGTTKGVIAGESYHAGRVIASERTRSRRAGKGMAVYVDVGMGDTCRDQAARRS